ncbi:2TM domain-containing protein [Moheibacter sp.]|uniref:2TM domain-containing protein n=1 Tax=Moheibacter sp. TaxID=1965316 RepID=UPI003C76BAB3
MEPKHNYTTEEYQRAKKAVEEKIGFYIHLACYLIVNGYFAFLSLKDGGHFWAIYPMAGWGIGLAFHGLGVFGFFNNSAWKERQVQKELEKQRRIRDGK